MVEVATVHWYPHIDIPAASAGTRIIYDRKFLLDCRNSPIARTPPCCLPQIPGVTMPSLHPLSKLQELKEELEEEKDLAGKLRIQIKATVSLSYLTAVHVLLKRIQSIII